jgi:hypothetical protein
MPRIASVVSLLIVTLLPRAAYPAEPLVVDLWPGKVPGDVGIDGKENSRIYQSPILGGPTRLITNVTKPSLTIYRPAADKNTGTAMLICPGGGYHDLFWELEGEEVAAWLNAHSMTGIILKYRVPRRPGDDRRAPPLGPLLDAQRAVSLVRTRAATSRSTPSTKQAAAPTSPSSAIRDFSRPTTRTKSGRASASPPIRRRCSSPTHPTTRSATPRTA